MGGWRLVAAVVVGISQKCQQPMPGVAGLAVAAGGRCRCCRGAYRCHTRPPGLLSLKIYRNNLNR